MSKKKPRETRKTRAWEQGRRNRLSEAFAQLCKLLPSYDPSIKLSKIEIIQQAGSCIQDLQEKVKQLLTPSSEESTAESVETVKKIQGSEIRKLHQRVRKLLGKNEQLCKLLKDAKITIPPEYVVLRSKQSKWTDKFTPEQARNLQRRQGEKENNAEPDKAKCDPLKSTSVGNATPKHRKVIHSRSSDQKKSKTTKRKRPPTKKKSPSKSVIVLSQPGYNTQSCYVITNAPSTNHIINGASTVITNSSFLTATPLVSSNVVKSYKPTPTTNIPQPVSTLNTTNTLLFAANGTILPIIPQPTIPMLPLTSQIIGNKPLVSAVPPPPKVIILPGAPKTKTTAAAAAPNIATSNPVVTSAPPVVVKGHNSAAAVDVKLSPRVIKPKKYCLTRTTQINKVPIPAMTARYSSEDLVLRERKDNVSDKIAQNKSGGDKTKASEKRKSVQDNASESQKKEEAVVVAKRKLNVDDEEVDGTKKNRTEDKPESDGDCAEKSDKNCSTTTVVTDNCGTTKEPNEPVEATSTTPVSSEKVGTSSNEWQNKSVELVSIAPVLSEQLAGIEEASVEHSTEELGPKPVADNEKNAVSYEQVAKIQKVVVEQLAEQLPKPASENQERDVAKKPEEVRLAEQNASAPCQEITESRSEENRATGAGDEQKQVAIDETVQQQKTEDSATSSDNVEDVDKSTQRTNRDNIKALELNLNNHSELSNDIFASLQVPSGCQNPESTSPTAAFLLAFPLVSSLTGGVKVTEVTEEDNTPGSQRETPTLLQIGTMDSTRPTQSHADSLTPSFLNLDSLSFFSSNNGNNSSNNHSNNNGVGFYTPFDSNSAVVPPPTTTITTAPGDATTSSATCSTAEQIKSLDSVKNNEQVQQQQQQQDNDSTAKVSIKTEQTAQHSTVVRQFEQQSQLVDRDKKEQKLVPSTAEQQSQLKSLPSQQPMEQLVQKQLQHNDNNGNNKQRQHQEQHCQQMNNVTNVQDCSVLQHFQNNNNARSNLARLDPLVNHHLMKLPPNKLDSGKNLETNRRHPHQQQQQQQQQVCTGYNNNNNNSKSSAAVVSSTSATSTTNNYQYNTNTFPDLSKITKTTTTFVNNSTNPSSVIKNHPDPLYTQCNNTATYNYGYPSTAQNTFNQNYYKTMATKDSRSYYSLNYENYSDYNSRKNDANSHFVDNYYNSSNNGNNNHYSTNKDGSSSSSSTVVANNNKPISSNSNNNNNNNKVQTNRPPINWMTAPDNKTQTADYVLPHFTKDSTAAAAAVVGDFISHNSISYSNSLTSVQTSYFNATNPIYSNSFDMNHQNHQSGGNQDANNTKKTCFDLPLVPPPPVVNSYNQHKNGSDSAAAAAAAAAPVVVEENQFSWSPTKIPQFLDHSHGFVSNTLPTLVGDLALSLIDQPSNKSHNNNHHKKDNNLQHRRLKNYENNNVSGAGNFLSVSQLVDHGKSEPQRTTARRNSANRSSKKVQQHQQQQSKQNSASNNSPRGKLQETNKDTIPSFNNNKATVDGKIKPSYNISNNVQQQQQQQQQANLFCDPSKNRHQSKNLSSSSYSAEALIGHQNQDNHQHKNYRSTTGHLSYPSSSAASIRTLPPPASFLTENMLPYFPPVELAPQQQQQQHQNNNNTSGYNMQPNQNYHLNHGHNYGNGAGFHNNAYTPNTFVAAQTSAACGVATTSTTYLSSNNFGHDSSHEYNSAAAAATDNLNLFSATSSSKVCARVVGTNKTQHHHHHQQQQIPQNNNTNSAKKPPKTPNKRHATDSNLPAGIVDFSFLSIPCSISSPILPDDFHSGFLQPPITAAQLYPCKNPLYSAATASTSTVPSSKQNDLASNSLLAPPPSLPQPPVSHGGTTTRGGTANIIHNPEISPTINMGSTATVGGSGGGGTSSLTNFNLSTIFPEINKPCTLAEPYMEPRIKDHPPKSYSSASQVTFNDKPTFSFSYINNCPSSQPFNNQ